MIVHTSAQMGPTWNYGGRDYSRAASTKVLKFGYTFMQESKTEAINYFEIQSIDMAHGSMINIIHRSQKLMTFQTTDELLSNLQMLFI